jgi:orotate phosphoribosyltransferase
MSIPDLQAEFSADRRRARLKQILMEQALIVGDEVRLASGRTSRVYFNVKKPLFDPEAAVLIAEEILSRLADEAFEYVGGMAMGAVPIVAAVCVRSFPTRPVRGFFVRKEIKQHGTQSRIEGYFSSGATAVLLEDVSTTGGSTLEAVRAVREAGGQVRKAITVIDRGEGARENLAREAMELISLFTMDEFLS